MSTDNYSGESGHKADAKSIIQYIHSYLAESGIETDSYGYDSDGYDWDNPEHRAFVRRQFAENGDVDEAILPAFGPDGEADNARDDCGDPHPFICDSCGHAVDFGRTCGQSVCGRCGVAWVRDTAINKAAKVRRVRKEKDWNTPDSEHQKIHHQVISPSLGWFGALAKAGYTLKEAQKATKKVVKKILSNMRAVGVLVRHSFRGADSDGSIADESDDRGKWKQRLFSGRDWYDDVRADELAWKPHYHCVVVADFLKGGSLTDRVQERTGWVIHRIADDDGISLESDGAMARALTYSLSHADIMQRERNNRSAVWEIGSFQGDPIKSSSRFTATPSDLDWADHVVRECAPEILGLKSGSTDCGATIPPVDDPDELARQILEELYPDDDDRRDRADTDAVLHHVTEGNLSVEVSTTDGGGGSVSVRDAFGQSASAWGGNLPTPPKNPTFEGAESPIAVDAVQEASDDVGECGCGDGETRALDRDGDDDCDGQLIPLDEARRRGLLDDAEWCREAAHVDEAREVDREHGDDLEPWRAESPGKAIGAG